MVVYKGSRIFWSKVIVCGKKIKHAPVAQLVEQLAFNEKVAGS
jgi:hypothetical protein